LVAAAKFLVAATKNLFVGPNFVAVTKPFFSVLPQYLHYVFCLGDASDWTVRFKGINSCFLFVFKRLFGVLLHLRLRRALPSENGDIFCDIFHSTKVMFAMQFFKVEFSTSSILPNPT